MAPKPKITKNQADLSGAPELSSDLLEQLAKHTAANRAHQKVKTLGDKMEVANSNVVDKPATDVLKKAQAPDEDDDFASVENDAAVDDIVRNEGDQLLAQTDANKQLAVPPKHGLGHAIGHFFARWWQNKWSRWITILALLAAVTTTAVSPASRYAVLNFFGVRASVTVIVYDNITRLPLKNISVNTDGNNDITNINGVAKVRHVRLGKQTVQIKRFGYKTISQNIVAGWGSNPLSTFYLVATGSQYKLTVNDYVAGIGVAGVEANSGQASAISDKSGVITLTLDNDAISADVTVQAKGYRSEQLHVDLTKATSGVMTLVPSAKAVYAAKQQGIYNVISSDVDGKNQATILAGTGRENANMVMAIDSTHTHVAVVSTRDNVHDSDGYLLNTLSVINLSGGLQTVVHAEQIKLIDWVGTRLVFEEAIAGASASNSQRYKIIAYDYATNAQVQLANANQFNVVFGAQGQIYYAVSNTDPTVHAAFWRIKPDGSSRQTIMNSETWSAFNVDYNTIRLQTPTGWFSYAINGSGTPQQSTQPANFDSIFFLPNSATQNIWVSKQTNPNSVNMYDVATGKNKQLHAQTGLNTPVYWLNDQTVVYRLASAQETADYAVSAVNSQTKKIADVVNTSGLAPAN